MDFFPSRHIARDTLDDLLFSILVAVATVMAAGLLDRVWTHSEVVNDGAPSGVCADPQPARDIQFFPIQPNGTNGRSAAATL